ncbi:MAG: hypothetical protein HKO95_01330 [Rhodobacteraceae bacterium]|nr:hypothetical protein [Paracoccaceae bacterium]
MEDEEEPDSARAKREIAMAARATIELFGNGALAKTRERLSEAEAEGCPFSKSDNRPGQRCSDSTISVSCIQRESDLRVPSVISKRTGRWSCSG